jgi:hypothetical protein
VPDYATTQEIAAFAQEFSDDETVRALVATAASRLFDNLCQVEENFFSAAEANATGRDFFGDGTAYLKLDPYVSLGVTDPVAIVDNDDNAQEVPDYFEQNGYLVIKGYGQGIPTRDVLNAPSNFEGLSNWNAAPSDSSPFAGWAKDFKITVTARWGFTAIPADVKQAVIQLAIHLWRMGDPAFTAISQSGQPYQPPAVPNQVKEIADRYREKYSQVALFA